MTKRKLGEAIGKVIKCCGTFVCGSAVLYRELARLSVDANVLRCLLSMGFAGLRTGVFLYHCFDYIVLSSRGLQVCGQAFLWHMVRCLMSVLLMVGRGHESPDVMSFLLDLERQASSSWHSFKTLLYAEKGGGGIMSEY